MDEHKSLMEALLAFQQKAPTLQKDAVNPHFRNKYVSLDAITQTVTPVLNECGLVWATMPCRDETGNPGLRYQLAHVPSGQELGGTMPLLLSKEDMQGLGSAYSYGRRYAMSAVLGLSAEDDDGAKASRPARQAQQPANGGARVTAPPAQRTEGVVTAKQRGLIFGKAGEKGMPPSDLANIVLAAMEGEARTFDSQEDAEQWLKRAMDRLPGRAVDLVLAGINRADPEGLPL